jgi:hypothetical protein
MWQGAYSGACKTSSTQAVIDVSIWAHPDGTSGLMPIYTAWDSSNNMYQISTQADMNYMFIQKIGSDGTMMWSMQYDVMTFMNEAVVTSDDSGLRLMVATMSNSEVVVMEIDTSKPNSNLNHFYR